MLVQHVYKIIEKNCLGVSGRFFFIPIMKTEVTIQEFYGENGRGAMIVLENLK